MSRIKSLYPCFQHWQERGNIIVFSDPHWEDSDCQIMNPEWIAPKEHIKRLLQDIHSGDTVVCLGDVGNPKYIDWIRRKRSHLIMVLITGNHDKKSQVAKCFDEVYDGAVMISPQIILSHEPVYLPFALNVHGHVHCTEDVYEYDNNDLICGVNLASDVCGFRCWNLNDNINKVGLLKDIPTMHRLTIDMATKNSIHKGDK